MVSATVLKQTGVGRARGPESRKSQAPQHTMAQHNLSRGRPAVHEKGSNSSFLTGQQPFAPVPTPYGPCTLLTATWSTDSHNPCTHMFGRVFCTYADTLRSPVVPLPLPPRGSSTESCCQMPLATTARTLSCRRELSTGSATTTVAS